MRWFCLLGAALGALALRHYALDDAYVTYRYADNVLRGLGFTYNPGVPVLTTTAPFFAWALVPVAALLGSVPLAGGVLSAAGLAIAALSLFHWFARDGDPQGGRIAAALALACPLLLSSWGMETCLWLGLLLAGGYWLTAPVVGCQKALAAGALRVPGRRQLSPANVSLAGAALLGVALLTRADAALPILLFGALAAWRRRRLPWREALVVLAVALLLVVALTWRYGSPLPQSLEAKTAQFTLGWYGYLPGTLVWWREFVPHPALFWLWLPFLLLGCVALIASALRHMGLSVLSTPNSHLPSLTLVWAAGHSAVYTWIKVAGYHWYYAPVALTAIVLAASGASLAVAAAGLVSASTSGLANVPGPAGAHRWAGVLAPLCAALLLTPELATDVALVRRQPEAKAQLYEGAGRWLDAHAEAGALVGVMEMGIVGFYDRRPTIDFAGLADPAIARALLRGDLAWAIHHYLPDYLVLTNINPLYSYHLPAQDWFRWAYHPVAHFDNGAYFGSPVTIYQRRDGLSPRAPWTGATPTNFGGRVWLEGYALDTVEAAGGAFLHLRLFWRRLPGPQPPLKLFAHVIDERFALYGGDDDELQVGRWPVGGEPVETGLFLPVQSGTPPGDYKLEVGLYDPATLKRLPVLDAQGRPTGAEIAILRSIRVQPGAS